MKKIYSLAISILSVFSLMAQLPNGSTAPNFTLTDINGVQWDLYTVLNQGKTVFIDVSATWCSPCWSYHNSHYLRDLYNHYGPSGTIAPDAVMVFFIEPDVTTTLADLQGTGPNTWGDWIQGTPYPIFNLQGSTASTFISDYQVSFYPIIYRICPDKKTLYVDFTNADESQLLASIGSCTFAVDASVQSVAGLPPTVCSSSISPVITIKNNGTTTLTSCNVTYDIDGNNPQVYNWTGSLATNASANINIPSMNVSNGGHSFHVLLSSPNNGTDNNTVNNLSTNNFIVNGGPGANTPLTEGFESTNFPSSGFNLTNEDNLITWEHSTVAGGFGNTTNSAYIHYFNNVTTGYGEKDEIVINPVDLSSVTNATLTFNVSHAMFMPSMFSDRLEVYASADCGATWTQVYDKSDPSLSSAPSTTSDFVPTPSQWRAETVSLTPFVGNNNVLLKFVGTNGYGNNIYLDDINITAMTNVGIMNLENGFQVYPNPVQDHSTVDFALSSSSDVSMTIYSIIGEVISVKHLGNLPAGNHQTTFQASGLAKGIYYLELNADGQKSVQKVAVK